MQLMCLLQAIKLRLGKQCQRLLQGGSSMLQHQPCPRELRRLVRRFTCLHISQQMKQQLNIHHRQGARQVRAMSAQGSWMPSSKLVVAPSQQKLAKA